MTKITCDRCGEEIIQSNCVEFPALLITAQENGETLPRAIDLCKKCRRKFYSWLSNDHPIALNLDATDWR